MKKLMILLLALIWCIGAKGQITTTINNEFYSYSDSWKNYVKNKNCNIPIEISFKGHHWVFKNNKKSQVKQLCYALHADTVKQNIIYTVYIAIVNSKTFITKTGTIEELNNWSKNPYKITQYRKTDEEIYWYKTDKKRYVLQFHNEEADVIDLKRKHVTYSEFIH